MTAKDIYLENRTKAAVKRLYDYVESGNEEGIRAVLTTLNLMIKERGKNETKIPYDLIGDSDNS
jgi:hypothetical protein